MRLALVFLLTGWKTGARFLSQSLSETIAIASLLSTAIRKQLYYRSYKNIPRPKSQENLVCQESKSRKRMRKDRRSRRQLLNFPSYGGIILDPKYLFHFPIAESPQLSKKLNPLSSCIFFSTIICHGEGTVAMCCTKDSPILDPMHDTSETGTVTDRVPPRGVCVTTLTLFPWSTKRFTLLSIKRKTLQLSCRQ